MISPGIDVIGFGALNVDLVYEISERVAERFQFKPGKEQKGRGIGSQDALLAQLEKEKLLSRSGGGSAANVTVALSRMGFKTGYLGKVGRDEEGDFLLSSLLGVETSQILRGEGRSGIVLALQTKNQKDRFMAVFPGENDTIDAADIDIGYINQGKITHFTSFIGERSFNAQIEILAKIDPNILVSFDGGELYARRGMNALRPFLKRSNMIFPSKEEVTILTGLDYKKGARELLGFGPQIVVVTLGSEGCYVLTKSEEFQTPVFPLRQEDTKDTTGAGDVFAASFLAGVLKKEPLRKCAEFANRMAAKSITGIGRAEYPTKDDLKYL